MRVVTDKTPQELLSEAGYELEICETEDDIQKYKRYYAPGEELCTFSGGRLESCYVFFAIKKNIDQIRREDFPRTQHDDPPASREDEYGTSVISIQFGRSTNVLSIKNRYNHTVTNPDATFSNNLENIIPGLTDSFQRTYGFGSIKDKVVEQEDIIKIESKGKEKFLQRYYG